MRIPLEGIDAAGGASAPRMKEKANGYEKLVRGNFRRYGFTSRPLDFWIQLEAG